MWSLFDEAQLAAVIGLAGGVGLGLAARLGRFCTLGAIEDLLYGGSDHRMRMWGLAVGVAILITFGLAGAGALQTETVHYLSPGWNPIAHVAGGLVFGYGMALAGNCGYGAIARLGGGDLRAFVIVLVMGISAYVVMAGPLAPARLFLFPPELIATETPSGLAHGLAALIGTSPVLPGLIVGGAILAAALASRSFLAERVMVFWGAAVGVVIGATWGASQWLSDLTFEATSVQNHTFAEPLGEVILYAMTSSGTAVTFAVGSVAGVWAGAVLGSLIKGHFRWEACEDPRELRRQIFGAVLMGGGAVISLGCSVGQGLSAISLLAFGAPLTLAAIFVGASLGLRSLIMGYNAV